MKKAAELIKSGLHTAEIVSGYQLALNKTLEILPSLVVSNIDDIRDKKAVTRAIKSVLSTKQYGYEELLADLVVEACLATMNVTSAHPKLNIDSVRISKQRGGNVSMSNVVQGMVVLRDTEGIIKRAENAKVIV